METALAGTGLPPCPAYDFSCALKGTLARTVDPGEKETPPKLREAPAATPADVKMTFSVAKIRLALTDLFKKLPDLMHGRCAPWTCRAEAALCLCEISLVDFKPHEFFDTAALRGDGGISNPEKRIEHRFNARNSVQFDAPLSQLDRKRRGMRSLFLAALHCLAR